MTPYQPLVSVLMPVYNGEKYLAEAIESIVKQTYANWELIVLDDGSTDASRAITLSYKDSRIRYEKNPQNLGIVETRNRLFDFAKGDFFAILDCDDVACIDKLQKQINYMLKNRNCGICGTWAKKVDEKGKIIGRMQPPEEDELIKINLLFQSSFIQSSVVLRKSVLAELRYNKEFPVAEDFDLWERISKITECHNLSEYLLSYRVHSGNISEARAELMKAKRNEIIARQLKRLGDFSKPDIEYIASIGSLDKQTSKSFFKEAKGVLLKLQRSNEEVQEFSTIDFSAFIAYRWIFYCVFYKQYSRIFSMISFRLQPKYWKLLFRLVAAKVVGK